MNARMMVCNRDYDLRTTFGSIHFEKNKPRLVPGNMVASALAVNILPVDERESEQVDALFETPKKKEDPVDPGTRYAMILEAVETIEGRNNPNDFAANKPKLSAIEAETGLAKVSAHELKFVLEARGQQIEDQKLKDLANKSTPPADLPKKSKKTEVDAKLPPDNSM